MGGFGDLLPVTVAGPRRTYTGFPFQSRKSGTFSGLIQLLNMLGLLRNPLI